jgi:hypothetical protein
VTTQGVAIRPRRCGGSSDFDAAIIPVDGAKTPTLFQQARSVADGACKHYDNS